MGEIEKVAVIGAGTMGSGIASHLANAGVPVLLMDVASTDGSDRSAIARSAIQRMLETVPAPFTHPGNADLITAGNIDDDLDRVTECDWIAEAIVERVDVKHRLYRELEQRCKPNAMISSNTSTIPLATLTEGMPAQWRQRFCITHFFNPVRYMRLLEIVRGPDSDAQVIDTLSAFCDQRLGKGVVHCADRPGFLGNRVGVYALQVGLVEAAAMGIGVDEADALVGRPMGIPKTGVFGLYDLIGLDLMLDVATSLRTALPASDAFQAVAGGIDLIPALVAKGYTGRKGLGGFYRERNADGQRIREAVDLGTGEYRVATRPALEAAAAGERYGLRALVETDDRYGRYAWRVLARTLSYAASLVPDVTDQLDPIDEAMRLGFNWNKGPFEMIDELGVAWFRERLRADDLPVPALLEGAGDGPLYRVESTGVSQRTLDGRYQALPRTPGVLRLNEFTAAKKRIGGNHAASIWDLDDGVACVEFHTKANVLHPDSMEVVKEATERAQSSFRGAGGPYFRAALFSGIQSRVCTGVDRQI